MNFFKDLLVKVTLAMVKCSSTIEIERLRKRNNVSIDRTFRPGEYLKFVTKGDFNQIRIESNVSCRRFCTFLVYDRASLIIEKGVSFNNNCSINCLEFIEIGEHSIFGESVKIYDHNHAYANNGNLVVDRNSYTTSRVSIGKNCWIGSNVVILKGVTIGDNVIIGANCLIHKSVPSNSIVKHSENLIINKAGENF